MKNPFKKRRKIEEEDLVEIKKREELINQHVLIAQALQNEMRGFLGSKMSKYGLDSQKDWSFDTKSGTIKEMKRPQSNERPVPFPPEIPVEAAPSPTPEPKKPVKKTPAK